MARIIIAKDANGTILASSENSAHAVEVVDGHWYFHPEQVNLEQVQKTERYWNCPDKGCNAYWYNLDLPELQSQNVAWEYPDPIEKYAHIAGYIGFWSVETQVSVAKETESIES